jgi:flagellar export protein FliJ
MPAFQFQLSRVFDWYDNQRQSEEKQLTASIAALTDVQEALARLDAQRLSIARQMISPSTILAQDLAALGLYRLGARKRELELNAELEQREIVVRDRRIRVQAAQRRVRLLEKLRERQQTEHDYAMERELEKMVADAYMSKWPGR